MKILWLVEPLLPQIAKITGRTPSFAGGWLVSVCDGLLRDERNSLTICYRSVGEATTVAAENLTAHTFQQDPHRYSPELERSFRELLRAEQPDVIHIWGTEYPFSLAMLTAAEQEGMLERAIVSLQGLISIIARHYTAGLPRSVVNGVTLRDFLRADNILQQQKKFVQRGLFEVLALQKAKHVVGRTSWDKRSVLGINPALCYHDCNETMRPEFYEGAWEIERCERRRIFVSQGNYPIKGMHKALEALAICKRELPDIKLVTTGEDPRKNSLQSRIRRGSYAKYLTERIRALGLDGQVEFLGALSAEEMKRQYLRAHVALNASAIENSSNAIGEAMLLGTPMVASRVGGTPDIVNDGTDGLLYPFDAPQQLTETLLRVMKDDSLAFRLSAAGRKAAAARYDADQNLARLLEIYTTLAARKEP